MTSKRQEAAVIFVTPKYVQLKGSQNVNIYVDRKLIKENRNIDKDDIYECMSELLTTKNRPSDAPSETKYVATTAKFKRQARTISGTGKINKISADGEYGFITYRHDREEITIFVTRITVQPELPKGGMLKFFTQGSDVRFVAKEQPPSGKFDLRWRTVTATDTKHDITDNGGESRPVMQSKIQLVQSLDNGVPVRNTSVTVPTPPSKLVLKEQPPSSQVPLSSPLGSVSNGISARPSSLLANPIGGIGQRENTIPREGTPASAATTNSSSSASSTTSGISYAARAASNLPAAVEKIITSEADRDEKLSMTDLRSPSVDSQLPEDCGSLELYKVSDEERLLWNSNVSWDDASHPPSFDDCWQTYSVVDIPERSMEDFECELGMIRRMATSLFEGQGPRVLFGGAY